VAAGINGVAATGKKFPSHGPPGVSGENNYTGAVRVFPGGSTRPTATGSKLFTASSVGLAQPYGTMLGGDGLLWII